MINEKKDMLNFEEVDKIRMFWGIDKGMILERGINRIIVKCKLFIIVCIIYQKEGINRIIVKCKLLFNDVLFCILRWN